MEYFIGLLFVLVIGWAIYGKSKNKARAKQDSKTKSRKPLISWGYVIKTTADTGHVCPQALKMRDKPIPVNSLADLPALPLAGCNQKRCQCQYQAMPERRASHEKREQEERRESIRFEDKTDRRNHSDRRSYNSLWKNDRS